MKCMGRNYVRRANPTNYLGVIAVERRSCCFWMVPSEPSSFSLCLFLEISSFPFLLKLPFRQLPWSPSVPMLWNFEPSCGFKHTECNWQNQLIFFLLLAPTPPPPPQDVITIKFVKRKGQLGLSAQDPFYQMEERVQKTLLGKYLADSEWCRVYGCSRVLWQL